MPQRVVTDFFLPAILLRAQGSKFRAADPFRNVVSESRDSGSHVAGAECAPSMLE